MESQRKVSGISVERKALIPGSGSLCDNFLACYGEREAIWLKQQLFLVLRCFFFVLFFLFSQSYAISYGNDFAPLGPESLIHKYHEIQKELEKNSGPTSFNIESSANKTASLVDLYGIIKYPFEMVQSELLVPANWCDIVVSHFKVKACTYNKMNDKWLLNIYNVNKSSESLENAYDMEFVYRTSEQPAYFDIGFIAHKGPSYTKDHEFELEAIPLGKNITFVHCRYSFSYNALAYFRIKLFVGSTIGFSIIGTDSAGNPVYVNGLRGSVERDVVYYYMAILAYLDTLQTPSDQRFERRISAWYDLTAHFKKQLFEMKREEYLTDKGQDWINQRRLQGDLNSQETCSRVKIC